MDPIPMTIPVFCKSRNIVIDVIVDSDCMKYSKDHLSFDRDGYVKWKGKTLHSVIMDCDRDENLVIDHINHVKHDNRRCNLRLVTKSFNAHNRTKKENGQSKYIGVYPDGESFTVRCAGVYYGQYKSEKHAAFAYDIAARENWGDSANTNGVDEPADFEMCKRRPENPYGEGICFVENRNNYLVRFRNKYIGEYRDLRIATIVRDAVVAKYKNLLLQKAEELQKAPIQRNEDGIAIVIASKTSAEPIVSLVDDEDWHHLMKFNWSRASTKGYISGIVENGEKVSLSRYLMKCTDSKLYVDHINGDKHDNRKENLRITDASGNSQNKAKKSDSSCEYYGVTLADGRRHYTAAISYKGKKKRLGNFEDPEEAAWVYDQKALELHGQHARINGVPNPYL